MRALCRLAVIVFFALCLSAAQQQQPAVPSAPPVAQPEPGAAASIKVQVNEVIVPVTVTDDKGRFVSNLDLNNFKIYDQGREQKIIHFTREQKQPVVVGFLLDLSNASRLHWAKFQDAARELVWNLLPGDPRFSGYLITYANDAELAVNTTQDSGLITDRIIKLKPGGGAALFDAIYMACTRRSLVRGEPIEPRRVLIIIGDGNDSASKKSLAEVLELAQRNLVTIYGISTQAFGFKSEGDENLVKLAFQTGGRVEYPLGGQLYSDVAGYLSNPSDEGNYAYKVGTGGYASALAKGIFQSIANVAGEITTQYILRYIPDNTDSAKVFRNIEVRVDLPSVKIRARKGYYPYNP
jgi:Ca-activated chloride channel homolog